MGDQCELVEAPPMPGGAILRTGDQAKKVLKNFRLHLLLSKEMSDIMPAPTERREAIKRVLKGIKTLSKGSAGDIFDATVIERCSADTLDSHVIIKTIIPRTIVTSGDRHLRMVQESKLYGEFLVQSRLNFLRQYIPNFGLLIGAYSCPQPEKEEDILKGELCQIESEASKTHHIPEIHLILEKVGDTAPGESSKSLEPKKSYTLQQYLSIIAYRAMNLSSGKSVDEGRKQKATEFYNIMKQFIAALKVAQDKLKFVHGDAHPGNLILVPLEKGRPVIGKRYFLKYPNVDPLKDIIVETNYLLVFIDFGLSRLQDHDQTRENARSTDDTIVGFKDMEAISFGLSKKFNPVYDFVFFFRSCTRDDFSDYGGIFKRVESFIDSCKFPVPPCQDLNRVGHQDYDFSSFSSENEVGAMDMKNAILQQVMGKKIKRPNSKKTVMEETINVVGYDKKDPTKIDPMYTLDHFLELLEQDAADLKITTPNPVAKDFVYSFDNLLK